MFFFFKQKTAYELRISDWSSDVCSSDLARQASVEDLDRVYGSIYATGSQFQVLQTMTPIFDEPVHLSDQGVLTLTGHYRTAPQRLTFELKYIFESPGWKLFGLSVGKIGGASWRERRC